MPENVNSAYAKSAHIPLSKLTARNTQKRAKTFTKQAAERYVENLAISSAKYDIFLFLFLRKEEWVSAWDTMITSCHRDRHNPTFEKDYKVKVCQKSSDQEDEDDEDQEVDEDEEEEYDEDEEDA